MHHSLPRECSTKCIIHCPGNAARNASFTAPGMQHEMHHSLPRECSIECILHSPGNAARNASFIAPGMQHGMHHSLPRECSTECILHRLWNTALRRAVTAMPLRTHKGLNWHLKDVTGTCCFYTDALGLVLFQIVTMHLRVAPVPGD